MARARVRAHQRRDGTQVRSHERHAAQPGERRSVDPDTAAAAAAAGLVDGHGSTLTADDVAAIEDAYAERRALEAVVTVSADDGPDDEGSLSPPARRALEWALEVQDSTGVAVSSEASEQAEEMFAAAQRAEAHCAMPWSGGEHRSSRPGWMRNHDREQPEQWPADELDGWVAETERLLGRPSGTIVRETVAHSEMVLFHLSRVDGDMAAARAGSSEHLPLGAQAVTTVAALPVSGQSDVMLLPSPQRFAARAQAQARLDWHTIACADVLDAQMRLDRALLAKAAAAAE